MDDVSVTLQQRGKQYGPFVVQAAVAQTLKRVMREHGWDKLKPDQREAFEHIAVKMARILCGNPDQYDSWHDIAGYAQLVATRLKPAVPDVG